MSFWDRLAEQNAAFMESIRALDSLPNVSARLGDVIGAVTELSGTLTNMQQDTRRTSSSEIVRTAKRLRKALCDYAASLHGRAPSAQEGRAVAALMTTTNQYLENTVQTAREVLDTMNADLDKVVTTDMEEIKEYGRKHTMFSRGQLDIAEASPEKGVGQLLWVGESVSLAQYTNQYSDELKASQPHQDYERLLSSLEAAEPVKQVQYAKLLANRERQLTQRLAETYETLLSRYEMQENGESNVMEALVNDESYRAARSYFALKERLMQGPMAQPLRLATKKLVTARTGKGLDIPALMDGSVEQRLNTTERGKQALANAAQKDDADFRTTGLPIDPFAQKIFGLATKIAADPDRTASPFYGIARQLFLLERENHSAPNTETYEKRLRACMFSAQAYLQSHRKVPFTQKGKNRVAIAREVLQTMQTRLQELEAKRNVVPEEMELPLENDVELSKLARNQVVAGATKLLEPPVPTRRSEVGERKDKQLRSFMHGAYTIFNGLEQITTGLPTNLVGGGMWLYDKIRGKTKAELNAQPFDSDRVPGMRNEKFREPEGDGIITDKRRIPLVWERPIPEDTDQPITLTFEVDQPYEGSDIGSDRMADKVGHAFLTLKYTKRNPATGQLERYKTSFGFYPKQSDTGYAMLSAMPTIGAARMGEIIPDFDHPISVGSTVTITPKQFNDIVRFTGDYEKGGYNMISRNCTDFAIDAVRHAGVSIPELDKVQKVDLTNKGILMGTGLFAIDLVQGHLLTHEIAKNHVLNKLKSRDVSQYSRLGQAEASREDIERIYQGKLNTRLRGYAPGETGEAIRGSYGFALHSKKYLGTQKTRTAAFGALRNKDNEAYSDIKLSSGTETLGTLKGLDRCRFLVNLMEQEIPRLRRKIEAVYGTKNPEINKTLEHLETFQNDSLDVIRDNMLEITQRGDFNDPNKRDYAMELLRTGAAQLRGYITGLNTIFHDVFKSDSRVNIPFQNSVSLAQWLNEEYDQRYAAASSMQAHCVMKYDRGLASGDEKTRTMTHRLERKLYDQSRDDSNAMWNANHIQSKFTLIQNDEMKDVYMRPSELLATMLAFDKPEEAVHRMEFAAVDKDNEITDSKAVDMINVRGLMVKALETYQDGHEYTDAELDAVFNRMPAFERKLGITAHSPAAAYQTMALNAIFGNGFLGDMNAEFMKLLDARRPEVEPAITDKEFEERDDSINDALAELASAENSAENKKKIDDLINRRTENQNLYDTEKSRVMQAMTKLVTDYAQFARTRLEERLRSLPPEKKAKLDHVTAIIANDLIAKRSPMPESEKRTCIAEAKEYIGTSLVQGYLNSICQKALKQMTLDGKLNDNMFTANSTWQQQFEANAWLPSAFRRVAAPAVNRGPSKSVHQAAPKQGERIENRPRGNSIGFNRK